MGDNLTSHSINRLMLEIIQLFRTSFEIAEIDLKHIWQDIATSWNEFYVNAYLHIIMKSSQHTCATEMNNSEG